MSDSKHALEIFPGLTVPSFRVITEDQLKMGYLEITDGKRARRKFTVAKRLENGLILVHDPAEERDFFELCPGCYGLCHAVASMDLS